MPVGSETTEAADNPEAESFDIEEYTEEERKKAVDYLEDDENL